MYGRKIAIITGASSGIGYEATLEIDRRFNSLEEIWIIGRNEEKLNALAAKLHRSVRIIMMDVTKQSDIDALEGLLDQYEPNIRMLFQSAGEGLHGRFMERTTKDQTYMLDLNCKALTNIAHICIPYMRKGSHMINLASSAGFIPLPSFAVYGASKAYVLNLSRALNYELAKRRIHVMAVCPGPVDTPFFDKSERYYDDEAFMKFKSLFMNTPKRVAKKAICDAALYKSVSTDTILITALRFLSKLYI